MSGSNPPSNPNSPAGPERGRSLTPNSRSRKPEYSLLYLQSQIDELISIAGNAESPRAALPASSTDRLVEVIRAIAETLLWGEQNEEDSQMFDYFCEKGVMKIFAALLNSPTIPPSSGMFAASSAGNRQIKIQLLQTMSLLLLNVKRQTSLYFLFSNNAVNQLINNNNHLDFSDEEILSYYVSLIKSISLRISEESIQFFINEKNVNYFPLFTQSIRFFDHHDRMVRIAVRTITLSIFKLFQSNSVLERFIRENSGGYFSLLACQLRDLWFLMDRTITGASEDSTLAVVTDEMIDHLEYLAEIEGLGIIALSDMMWSKMEAYAIDGVLLTGLLGIVEGGESPRLDDDQLVAQAFKVSPATTSLSSQLSLYIFLQFLDVFSDSCPVKMALVAQFTSQDKSRIELEIKKIGPSFSCLIGIFIKLYRISDSLAELRNTLGEFGILPPRSIEITILVAQSIAKSIDHMSLKQLKLTLNFLESFLCDQSLDEAFKRPVRLTAVDSFKVAATRICERFPELDHPTKNQVDNAVIDLFESVILEIMKRNNSLHFLTSDDIDRTLTDPCLLHPNSKNEEWRVPSEIKEMNSEILNKFLLLTIFVKNIVQDDCVNIAHLYESLFEPSIDEVIAPTIVSGEHETLRIPENLLEGSSVDLGRSDRIVCTHLTSPGGSSTRFVIVDKTRLILVAPDLTRPGFATIKFSEKLRRFKSISIYRDDQRILVLQPLNAHAPVEQLSFEDMKRCHLALMHLETQRIEIRKRIYRNVEQFLRKFIHYI